MRLKFIFLGIFILLPIFSLLGEELVDKNEKSYIIKVTSNEAFLDKSFPKTAINQEIEIYNPGERLVHPITNEVIEIDTVIGKAYIKSVKSNYSVFSIPSELAGKIKVGQYALLKGAASDRAERHYYRLYQSESAKKLKSPNLMNISNRAFYFNKNDYFHIARFYYRRDVRSIFGPFAVDFLSFGFQGGYGRTIIESCDSITEECLEEKIKPNFLQGFFQAGIRLGSWIAVYGGFGVGLGDTKGANSGTNIGAILGNKKSVYLDVGYYRFADFIEYTTVEFSGVMTSGFDLSMEFGVQKFPNREGAVSNFETVDQFNYGMFQLGGKFYIGDILYLKLLAGVSGVSTKRLGPMITLETGILF
ncbi:MAG: hypothetical protein OEZ13_06885 [Spirochaetia bacterium]|nr:hypothetical protein [Spirochaetia bacterium]